MSTFIYLTGYTCKLDLCRDYKNPPIVSTITTKQICCMLAFREKLYHFSQTFIRIFVNFIIFWIKISLKRSEIIGNNEPIHAVVTCKFHKLTNFYKILQMLPWKISFLEKQYCKKTLSLY